MQCKTSLERDLQAANLQPLDPCFAAPRLRDLPDPVSERPSFMKKRARQLLRKAAFLAVASTRGGDKRDEIARLRAEADRLVQQMRQTQMDLGRAATHPATQYTATASGAQHGEPLSEFPRALRRTLLELGVSQDMADHLVDTGNGTGDEGQKGEGKKGGRKGRARRARA